MNNTSQRQSLFWIGLTLATFAGIGLIAFLLGRVLAPAPPVTPTPVAPTITPLPAPVVSIQSVKAQAELSTVKYNTVAEVYNENVPEGWLDGVLGTKERLLMLVYGDVRAGFDLNKLEEGDLWTEGTRVRLVLPEPEIQSTSIDFERTHIVYYENNMLLEQNNPNLQGEALAQATEALRQAALREGILDNANKYGQAYFENFLYSLGFTEVEVVVDAQIYEE